MSHPTRNLSLRFIALAAMLGTPLAAGAQAAQSPQPLEAVRASANVAAVRAGELHASGTVASQDLKKLRKAAHLHEQSAALRELADPQAFACLHEAALLRYYGGQRSAAAALMEKAARLAADQGDVINASRAFSDAAIIAYELKQGPRAWNLAVRAEALTASPLLSDPQREALRLRNVRLDRSSSSLALGSAIGAP